MAPKILFFFFLFQCSSAQTLESITLESSTLETLRPTTRRTPSNTLLRWCLPSTHESDLALCEQMSASLRTNKLLPLICIQAPTPLDCIQHLDANISDAVRLSPEDIYVGGKHYGIIPLLQEKWPEEFSDDAVVVVKKPSPGAKHDAWDSGLVELKGKRLCLSGVSEENIQYQALLNVLFPLGFMSVTNCQDPLASIAEHFGPSCAPGKWSLDAAKKKQYSSLCEQCSRVCTEQDFYGGSDGALRCLQDGKGDIAFSSSQAVLRSTLDPDKYQFLCIQGGKKPLNQSCLWLGRRTPAIALSARTPLNQRSYFKSSLQRIFRHFHHEEDNWTKYWHANLTKNLTRKPPPPEWFNRIFLSRENVSALDDVYYRNTYDRFVGEVFVRSMENPFPSTECGVSRPLRYCVYTPGEYQHCTRLSLQTQLERIRPSLSCIKGRSSEECQRLVQALQADLTLLRADEVLNTPEMLPIASEVFPSLFEEGRSPTSLYLLALIQKESNLTFHSLQGSRSCHSGAEDFLSFYTPLTLLERREKVDLFKCDYARAASAFFWESCVPMITKGGDATKEALCSLCGGIEQCGEESPYRDYTGSLRCLDKYTDAIAFVPNTTLSKVEKADKRYKLLCLEGGTKPVSEYEKCSWLKIPARILVVSSRGSYSKSKDRKILSEYVLKMQERFQKGMFEEAYLRAVFPEESLESVLGEEFSHVYRAYKACTSKGERTISILSVFLILCMLAIFMLL